MLMPALLNGRVSRRKLFFAAGGAFASVAFGEACGAWTKAADGEDARLTARPRADVTTSLKTGLLGLGQPGQDGMIQMPSKMPDGGVPLLVYLHGASQSSASMIRRVGPFAEEFGVALFCPDSRNTTWDAIRGQFGEDVVFLNRALEHIFARLAIDPARLAIGGFSDGASYALSLGLANGDVFPKVVVGSPGFVMPAEAHGRARFYVSHGTADQILPIDQCSRVIVPRLRAMGLDVTYREFEGRHELPAEIAREAFRWMMAV
jgi:phospholipase/carboxylesterase